MKRLLLVLFLAALRLVCAAMPDSLLMVRLSETGALMQAGKYDSVLTLVVELLPVARENGNAVAQATLHNAAGSCLTQLGRPDDGMQAFRQSAAIAERSNLLQAAINDRTGRLLTVFATMYGQMSLHCHNSGKRLDALRYARTALQWLSYSGSEEKALRVTVMSCIGPAFDAALEWQAAYPLLLQSFTEAQELGLYDFALVLGEYLLRCEDATYGRGPDARGFAAKADLILPLARTKEARQAYIACRDALRAKYAAQGQAEQSPASEPKLPQATAAEDVQATAAPLHAEVAEATQQMPPDTAQSEASASREAGPTPADGTGSTVRRFLPALLLAAVVAAVAAVLLGRRHRKRRRAENERLMAEKYVAGREDEAERLARELHDGVSNQLLAVEMKLSTDGLTTQTLQLLNESREQVRRVSHELIQPEFTHSTLDSVLTNYAANMSGTRHCEVNCTVTPTGADWSDVPGNTALEVYRIVQEVVSNVLKHSQATVVSIGLHRDGEGNIMVLVSDNGEARGTAQDMQGGGIGQSTIRQRASAIGASLHSFRHQYGNVFKLVVKSAATPGK